MSDEQSGNRATGPSALDRSRVLEGATALLADGVPRRAKEIAATLSQSGAWVDKSLVNSVLIREGNGQFAYDRSTFTYRLVGSNDSLAQVAVAIPTGENHPREAVIATARQLLADGKPRTAREITLALREGGMAGLDKSVVNSVLTREGKGEFRYEDQSYTYP
ncbi:MAG: hypothetical protein DLM69_00165 [Candidatus Chloroheliales bacterium]|nr:MAG: hypothetical protein DLM69_00165 [Chloroflexota bacterium]